MGRFTLLIWLGFFGFFGAMAVARPAAGAEPGSRTQRQLDTKSQELEDLRYRIRASHRKAEALAKSEQQQVARLSELDRQKALTEELLRTLDGRSTELRTRMRELQSEIDALRTMLQSREVSLATRLRQMYMRPRASMVAAALGSSDMSRMGARVRAMRHIAATEERMIRRVASDQQLLREKQTEIEGRAAEIAVHQSETQDGQMKLTSLREERAAALAEIQRQHQSNKISARQLERAARALEDLIAELEERRQNQEQKLSTGFAALQGELPWPVRGTVVSRFGPSTHPRFQTQVINKGWKIAAANGTPIQALAEGTVDFVDWLPGYGQCIIVNHGDGYYSLYAHASTVFPRVGTSVTGSEVIAEVGDTGSVEGSMLYLEIRQGRTPLDPAKWLTPTP